MWKYREDLSPFGNRIRQLLNNNSIRDVATAFYDSGLITVTPRKNQKQQKQIDEAFAKRASGIGSIEKRIREHINADGPECLQGEYVTAYCTYFNCSADYLFLRTDIKSSDIQIQGICSKTGLSETAITNLCEYKDSQEPPTFIHQCWSRMMEADSFLGLPLDWTAAFNEKREYIICNAALKAIEIVLENEDPETSEYNLVSVKVKPIQKSRDSHYAAYYGILHKLSTNITALIDEMVETQVIEHRVFEEALEDLTLQYRNELYAFKGQPDKVERPKDGEFRFHKHFIV